MSPFHALVVLLASVGGEPIGEVLDFSASYCGPCREMKPLVARLEREGLPIRQVDVKAERALAERFHVDQIPTFILVIHGREVARHVGKLTEADLRRMCARVPEAAAEPQVLLANNPPKSRAAAQSVELRQSEPAPKKSNAFLNFFRRQEEENVEARANDAQTESVAVAPVTIDDPMAASVRIRATINGQISLGSGTVVSSQPGRTYIVTCGHIFRDYNDSTKVEVDLFEAGEVKTYVATIHDTDHDADVGLISIPTHSVVSTTPLAPPTLRLVNGDAVVCIGCSAGKDPTAEPLKITAVNKYDGPDTIECTGTPVQGRSGGGLFNAEHQLIGVCIAAVLDAELGVYAHAFAVHALLDRNGLSHLYRPQPETTPEAMLADTDVSDAPADFPADHEVLPIADDAVEVATTDAIASETDADLASAMADFSAGDAEVVVIIRSRSNPTAQSRVVIINRASPKFLAYLNGEIRPEGLAANRPMPRRTSPQSQGDLAAAARGPASVPAKTQPVSFQPPRRVTPPRRNDRESPRQINDTQHSAMTAAK